MIPETDIVMPRFQVVVLAAILFQSLHPIAIPTIVSAEEQEPPSRHSLIHRSAAESATLPATAHGTILRPSSAESTHIASPIEPHKPSVSVSPVPIPAPHHRTLTKRPAIATITAPATSSQAPPAASVSGIAAWQVTQTTADTGKSTTPTATAPITKSAAAPLPGMTSSSSVATAPLASAAGNHPVASAGSSSAPTSTGSRSALNLLRNSSIARLLQPSTPPSTPPSPSPSTGTVTLTWTTNREPDLAGYKIYLGTASGTYDSPGSPFLVGNIRSYIVSNLPKGQTYFLAISAYDSAGNESELSAEVSKSLY